METFALLGSRPAGYGSIDELVVFAVSWAGCALSSGCL